MDSEHRKIELQSPSDLSYLTSQIRTAARKKLDLHLPPVSDTSEPDELRRSVEDLVEAFVAQVLQGMRHNISINGIDVVSRDGSGENDKMEGVIGGGTGEGEGESLVEREEFEPFDDKLRTQLGAAVAKRDALIAKISQHRRGTPAAAAARFVDRFERENTEVQGACKTMEEQAIMLVPDEVAGVAPIARQDEVARNWERAVEGLQRLNKGLPETRARLERAGDVVGYLGGEQGRK
jgi:kinetochor protein Mis14/NSL1